MNVTHLSKTYLTPNNDQFNGRHNIIRVEILKTIPSDHSSF